MVKCAQDMRALVPKYNLVAEHFPEAGYATTAFDDIKLGEFPWTEARAHKYSSAHQLSYMLPSI
eukprot:1172741-Prorocentrum_minimum.AAC.2